ncbi:MAG: outer membrane protein [Rhizobiaceae bacterium]
MNTMLKFALAAGTALMAAQIAQAADLIEPPVIETPPPVIYEPVQTGGWYIRGDVDYSWFQSLGVDYHAGGTLNSFTTATAGQSFSVGAGIGYEISKFLRAELAGDYEFRASFRGSTAGDCTLPGGGAPGSCTSVDTASFSVFELMANAYADLGHYHGITPYVGAGIGGAYVSWSDLTNTATCTTPDPVGNPCDTTHPGYVGNATSGTWTDVHGGRGSMRFAWALMAGVSYDINPKLKLDVGYRFKRIEGGRMFRYLPPAGGVQGYDRGFNSHTIKVGLRYKLGATAHHVQPEPMPVIYKN